MICSLCLSISDVTDQASISNVQLAGMSAGNSQSLDQLEAEEDQSLETAGFAGTVAQAYATYDYV